MNRLIVLISLCFLSLATGYPNGNRIADFSQLYENHSKTDPNYPFDSSEEAPSYLIRTPVQDQEILNKILLIQGKMNFYRYNETMPSTEDIQLMKDSLLRVREEVIKKSPGLFAPEPSSRELAQMAKTNPQISLSEIWSKMASELLVEPDHLDEFKNIFEGKKFYENISSPKASLPTKNKASLLTAPLPSGSPCDSFFSLCGAKLFCVEDSSEPSNPSCIDEGSTCNGGHQCCSGQCEFGRCRPKTRCSRCIPEGISIPSGAKCCPGMAVMSTVTSLPNEVPERICIRDQKMSPPPPAPAPYSFRLNEKSCAPVLINSRDQHRFERNERVLLAFEYLFMTTPYNDKYNHLGSIKKAAQQFHNARVGSKRSYGRELHDIMTVFKEKLRSFEGLNEVRNADALGANYYHFFIQEQKALLKKQEKRLQSYPPLKALLNQSINSIQQFNWNKKRWFKKNRCGKWGLFLVRGKHHKNCYEKSWNVQGRAQSLPSNIEDFLKGEGLMSSSPKKRTVHLLEKDYPRQCQTDPVFPAHAGFHIGKVSSLGSLRSLQGRIKPALQSYGATPLHLGQQHLPSLSGVQIDLQSKGRLDPQGRPYDLLGDLTDVVIRSMLSYGHARTCNNLYTSRTKVRYLRVVQQALKEVLAHERSSSYFKKSQVIPCLEIRWNLLTGQNCEPTDPDCHKHGGGDPEDPVDPTDPVYPVDPTDPVYPVDPTDPVYPVPADPVDPVDPGKRPPIDGGGNTNDDNIPWTGIQRLKGYSPFPFNPSQSKAARNNGKGGSRLGSATSNSQGAFQKRKLLGHEGDDSNKNSGKSLKLYSKGKGPLDTQRSSSSHASSPRLHHAHEGDSLSSALGKRGTGNKKYDKESSDQKERGDFPFLPQAWGKKGQGRLFNSEDSWQKNKSAQTLGPPQRVSPNSELGTAITHGATSSLNRPDQSDSLFQRVHKAYARRAFPVLLIERELTGSPSKALPFKGTVKKKKTHPSRPSRKHP